MRMKIVKMTFRMLRDESDSMGYFLPIMIFLGVPYGKVVNTITSIENQCNIYDGSYLSLLTSEECDISRWLLASVILGGAIGYERQIADRPADLRTMELVSLGSQRLLFHNIEQFVSRRPCHPPVSAFWEGL